MGQLPSTTKPARMIADTRASQASGCLWANTMTRRPPQCKSPVARLEGSEHPLFVRGLRAGPVAAESACIVDDFAVVLFVIPLGCERVPEGAVHFGGESKERSAKPDVEEVHQVRVRDGIVIWGVRNDEIMGFRNSPCCALAKAIRPRFRRHGRHGVGHVEGNPFELPTV